MSIGPHRVGAVASGRRARYAPDPKLIPHVHERSSGEINLQKILGRPQTAHALIRGHIDHIGHVLAAFAAGDVCKPAINAERDPVWNIRDSHHLQLLGRSGRHVEYVYVWYATVIHPYLGLISCPGNPVTAIS